MNLLLDLLPAAIIAIPAMLFFLRSEYMRGRRTLRAGPRWVGAWAALFVAGLISLPTWELHPVMRVAGRLLDAGFAMLMFAGACAFVDRPIPRAALPLAIAFLAAEVTLGLTLPVQSAGDWGSLVEAPVLFAAAVLVWRGRGGHRAGFAERVLAGLFFAVAALELLDVPLQWIDPALVVRVWFCLAIATGFVQLLVFGERAQGRERQLRARRDLLRRVAVPLTELGSPREVLGRLVSELERERLHPFLGAWLRAPAGGTLELVRGASEGDASSALRDGFHALVLEAARATDITFFDAESDRATGGPLRAAGVAHGFVAPLRAGGVRVGVLAGVFRSAPDADDREFVSDLADEASVLLSNAALHEALERRTEELEAQQRVLHETVEAVPVGILLADHEDRIRLFNATLAEQLGVRSPSRWLGRPAAQLLDRARPHLAPADAAEIARSAARYDTERASAVGPFELRIESPQRRVLIVSAAPVLHPDGRRVGGVWVTLDVTRERELGEAVQHTQRMETLGTLAGGLAHDFNNQLTAILGNARLVLDALPEGDAQRERLLDLERSAQHCADLTQGLLAFARRSPASKGPIDVGLAIDEVVGLLRPATPAGVAIDTRVDPATPPIAADGLQLRRVLVNLVTNARDAVGAQGRVQVTARPLAGERVELVVSDDGAGMDEATKRHIFDPFFTTKEIGRGTGLGLPVVYGIVAAHGGTVAVESAPGAGSAFTVIWPAASGARERHAPAAREPGRMRAERRATILLAEDEPVVRRLTRTALEMAGHRVVEAADGESAVREHDSHHDEIELAILDLSMPRRSGLEALDLIRLRHPGLPAIVMSGHPDRERSRPWPADVVVLPKPFGPRVLLARVDELLAARASVV